MKIVEFLRSDAVIANLSGQTGQAVLAELCRPLAATHRVDAQRLLETLLDREKLGSTGIGEGVAIPHGKVPGLPGLMASFGRSVAGHRLPRHRRPADAPLLRALRARELGGRAPQGARAHQPDLQEPGLPRRDPEGARRAEEIYRLIEAEDAKY